MIVPSPGDAVMLASLQRSRLPISRATKMLVCGERCRVWFAIALYVLTSVVWPFESGHDCGQGATVGRRSGCCCSAEKRANGSCCCAKPNKAIALSFAAKTNNSKGATDKRCCSKGPTKSLPSQNKSCCGNKIAAQNDSATLGWTACDCPSDPGSTLAPAFQPRICPQTEFAWNSPSPHNVFFAPTLIMIGADREPPTPPPKIVL